MISLQFDTDEEYRRRCDSKISRSFLYDQSVRQRALSVASGSNNTIDRKKPYMPMTHRGGLHGMHFSFGKRGMGKETQSLKMHFFNL